MKARTSFLLVSLLGAAFAGPAAAGAGTSPATREEIRARKAAAAAELDAANASEDELDAALAALDEQVVGQTANVESARQALAAAEGELAAANVRLSEAQVRITAATTVLVERAVRSFMEPETEAIEEMVTSDDVTEAARKRAMLDQVSAKDEDVIDALNLARDDFEAVRGEAEALTASAAERRTQAESELASLEAARAEKAKMEAAVQARQEELLNEIAALAADEAALYHRIATDAAAAAARRKADAQAHSRSSGADGGIVAGPSGAGGCIWPADGTVTSGFGARWGRLHAGVDVAAPTGTPIHASVAGVVSFAGVQGGYGNVIVVDHGGGFTTLYAHQSRLGARVGQSVAQGEGIGFVGSTGHSTGPHLHFETRYGGTPRNPRACLP